MVNIFNRFIEYFFGTKTIENKECKMETMENTMETNITETKDYTFKIDRVKWKAAVDAVLARREADRAKTEKKNWASLDYYYDAELTKLYSIRAHARGRMHRLHAIYNYSDWRKMPSAKSNMPKYDEFTQADGAIKFKLTMADQAAYIGDSWKEYEKHDVTNPQN
jgi:hypothetical protein